MTPSTPHCDTACAYINPAAIEHNLLWLRGRLSLSGRRPTPRIWAVVKGDAYGHGLDAALAGLGPADGIAVLTLSQLHACRTLGWRKPILVLSALLTTADLQDPALFPLHLTVDNEQQLAELEQRPAASPPYVWLRYRGSLNYTGFDHKDYEAAHTRLQRMLRAGRLAGLGHLQHYANAEDAAQLDIERQVFSQAFAPFSGLRCTENSAALLVDSSFATDTDWVRSGIVLYGISPLENASGPSLGLEPAMVLAAPIHAVQQLHAGQTIGYGSTFSASRTMRVGLIHCGYADGYPRNIAKDCPVLINGRLSRIVGRVSMDSITIDLDAHPEACPGTMVTLWGAKDLPIEVIAQSAGTIPAQLCSGLTARVPRVNTRESRHSNQPSP